MTAVWAAAGLSLWAGATLLLSQFRWVRRPTLAARLGPHLSGARTAPTSGPWSVASLRDVLTPLAHGIGERVSRAAGVHEQAAHRLDRISADIDATAFRLGQCGWALAAFGAGFATSLAIRPPLPVIALLLIGSPLLAFLLVEQQLANRSSDWQRRTFLELPVVVEQIATLLSAGYSLSGAVSRIAERSSGACATDLRRVRARIQSGLAETDALREWADRVDVDALSRVVPVLALNRETPDLGRLLGEEARSMRREVQRERLAVIERRTQQVWIPVTVATLIPGVIFLAVPFLEALLLFAGS